MPRFEVLQTVIYRTRPTRTNRLDFYPAPGEVILSSQFKEIPALSDLSERTLLSFAVSSSGNTADLIFPIHGSNHLFRICGCVRGRVATLDANSDFLNFINVVDRRHTIITGFSFVEA